MAANAEKRADQSNEIDPAPQIRRRLKGHERREVIVSAAVELFARQSFDSVGMRDVAAACGLTATAIYRQFENKEALLVAIFDRCSNQILGGIREGSRGKDAHDRLIRLIRFHISQVIREPAMIPIYQHEQSALAPDERRRFRVLQRDYIETWTEALSELRPELSPEATRTTVVAVIGSLNAMAYYRTKLGNRALERLLQDIAWRSLGLDRPADDAAQATA